MAGVNHSLGLYLSDSETLCESMNILYLVSLKLQLIFYKDSILPLKSFGLLELNVAGSSWIEWRNAGMVEFILWMYHSVAFKLAITRALYGAYKRRLPRLKFDLVSCMRARRRSYLLCWIISTNYIKVAWVLERLNPAFAPAFRHLKALLIMDEPWDWTIHLRYTVQAC